MAVDPQSLQLCSLDVLNVKCISSGVRHQVYSMRSNGGHLHLPAGHDRPAVRQALPLLAAAAALPGGHHGVPCKCALTRASGNYVNLTQVQECLAHKCICRPLHKHVQQGMHALDNHLGTELEKVLHYKLEKRIKLEGGLTTDMSRTSPGWEGDVYPPNL
eukprot:865058-Pelagomonas_calceolata.AAC.7